MSKKIVYMSKKEVTFYEGPVFFQPIVVKLTGKKVSLPRKTI